jgi:transposase
MLTQEENVEAHALRRRGWSIAAIARHLGRDRKTIRAYLRGEREPGARRPAAPDHFATYEDYVRERLREDPHLWASALHDELRALGYDRSYQILTREIRRRELRPRCLACLVATKRATIEIAHEPGEEIQWDWLELPDAPWGGVAQCLVGTLSHSGRVRAVLCAGTEQADLVEGIDHVLRQLGGTARRWRFDRMASVCDPASGALRASFAAVARHYGVAVDVCPGYRAQRKGAVESRNRFITQRFWRSMRAASREEAQRALERFCQAVGDARPRGLGLRVGEVAVAERLLPLPATPYPATVSAERVVSRFALVGYRGNRYSLPPGLEGATVGVRHRLGAGELEILAPSGQILARHRMAPPGAGALARSEEHRQMLEEAVLSAFSARRPCRRKANRPPGQAALAAAGALGAAAGAGGEVRVDLERYARYAGAAR